MTPAIPVLMYHSVTECPPSSTRRLSVHPDTFGRQLGILRRRGFTSLTFGEYAAARARGETLPERSVVLTFDDGYADFYHEALPQLDRHGFTATVFVTTGWLADAGRHAMGSPLDRMLTWTQLREMAAVGIEIGAHSHSHPQLDQMADSRLSHELRHSKSLLEDGLGHAVHTLAYPYGHSSRRVRGEAVASGYQFAAAVANRASDHRADPFALPRLTVRRSTSPQTFENMISLQRLGQMFAMDRTLTAGFQLVRRARYAAAQVVGPS